MLPSGRYESCKKMIKNELPARDRDSQCTPAMPRIAKRINQVLRAVMSQKR